MSCFPCFPAPSPVPTSVIHGDGTRLRRLLHVSDVIGALDIVMHNFVVGEAYNITSERVLSLTEIATSVMNELGLSHMKGIYFMISLHS